MGLYRQKHFLTRGGHAVARGTEHPFMVKENSWINLRLKNGSSAGMEWW